MPISKEYSIVADSTASSSPTRPVTPVKRAVRTYGRPREPAALEADDPDHSFSSASSSSLRSSTYRTGPLDTQEEIPPSSPGAFSSPDHTCTLGGEEEEDQGGQTDASPVFEYSWKAKLRDIDSREDEGNAVLGTTEKATEKSRRASPFQALSSEQSKTQNDAASRPSITPQASLIDDIFNGSLSTLTASQGPSSPGEPDSPIPTRRRITNRERQTTLHSDAEEDSEDTSPTKHSFPIFTPPQVKSPTPPTPRDEDDDMHLKASAKSKGKAPATRQSVPPLQFENETTDASRKLGTKSTEKQPVKIKGKDSKTAKTKKPTASERREADKERARMKAEKSAKVNWASGKVRNMATFMSSMASTNTSQTPANTTKVNSEDSDVESSPIMDFTSPVKAPVLAGSAPKDLRAISSDSEDELPDIGKVLAGYDKKKLLDYKLRLAAQSKKEADDDDDLEIVPSDAQVSKPLLKKPIPATENKVLPPPKHRVAPIAKKPAQPKRVDDYNKDLLARIRTEEDRVRKRKEEEWVRRGGQLLKVEPETDVALKLDWKEALAKKHFEALQAAGDASAAKDEDESDEDWTPNDDLRGSASPEPGDDAGTEDVDMKVEEKVEEDVMENDSVIEDGPSQEDAPMRVARSRPRRAVVGSDTEDENDENLPSRGRDIGRVLVPGTSAIFDPDVPMAGPSRLEARRGSCSSFEGGTEDEYDKENDTRRMYDHGEDKENTAVVRHSANDVRPPLGSRQGSLLGGLTDRSSNRLSMSPGGLVATDDENDENNPGPTPRQPLKLLRSEDSLLTSPSKSFFERLQGAGAQTHSRPEGEAPGPSLQPALNLSPNVVPHKGGGFSQFSDDEAENFAAPALQSGFADLFDANTQANRTQSVGDDGGFGKPGKLLSLGLTQDVEARPVLAINEALKREADEIFEKEQGYVVERAHRKIEHKPELYINDAGFLTQTRPIDGTPVIYRPLPTQTQSLSLSRNATETSLLSGTQREQGWTPSTSTHRTPFRDISLSGPDFENTLVESPTSGPRRRRLLKRRSSSPEGRQVSPTPSLTPGRSLLDAFGIQQKKKQKRERKPLVNSEFVQGEAQESDEETFGFVKSRDDDEDLNEDLDKTLETLVDDKEMDEDTVAEDKVLEKYKEQAELDDKANEELHMRAIQGELRKKRTHGLGIDDSDDEEDDEERARRIRRRMDRGARIDRQNIKELGDHPETLAFFNSYTKGVKDDDDNDLAYLQQQSAPDFVMGEALQHQEGADDEEDEESSGPGEVNRSEILAQVRQIAQEKPAEDEPAFNPRDVSWADVDDEVDEANVTVRVSLGKGSRISDRGVRRRDTEIDMDSQYTQLERSSSIMDTEEGRSRMESWAKTEERMRTRGGNGRSVAGAAITGHRKLANGGGSLRRGHGSASATKPADTRPVRAAPSLLKAPTLDRSSRFGQ
ncbi:hypothetical protein VNI00_000971 [Paramarasmius palmivorus]|uniref:DNA replication checkpoint mediator MRC1 domain-containing protein n=1 Tax=Paramarasmius palmivorus TaxID=297713 RepID=A0AAW0E7R4_9AGAR